MTPSKIQFNKITYLLIPNFLKTLIHPIPPIKEHINKPSFIDVPKEEQIEFIENLPIAVADEMQEFMKAMPVLAHNVEYNCPHCGADQIVNINGYEHFFA